MLKINLVPEVQEKKQNAKKMNSIAITVAAVLIIATVVINVILLAYLNIRKIELAATRSSINKLNNEISKYKELEETVINLEKGLKASRAILDSEYKWTNLFNHLENATPGDTAYTKINVSSNAIKASLKGSSIDSLARYIDSFKNYKAMVITGTDKPGKPFRVYVDSELQGQGNVKSSGSWTFAISPDPNIDHDIKIEFEEKGDSSKSSENNEVSKETDNQNTDQEEEQEETNKQEVSNNIKVINIKYTAEKKEAKTDYKGVNIVIKKIFSNVHTKEYKREGGIIKFDVLMNFDGSALW